MEEVDREMYVHGPNRDMANNNPNLFVEKLDLYTLLVRSMVPHRLYTFVKRILILYDYIVRLN